MIPFFSKKRVIDLCQVEGYPSQDALKRCVTFGTATTYLDFNSEAIKSDAINILEKLDGSSFIGIEPFQSLVLMSGEDITGNMAELMAKLAIVFCDVSGGESGRRLWPERLTYELVLDLWKEVGLKTVSIRPDGGQRIEFMVVKNSPIACVVKDWNQVEYLKHFGMTFDIWTAIRNSNTERRVGLSHIGYTLCKLVDDGLANIIANFGRDNPSKFVSMVKRLPKVSGLDDIERIPAWTAIGLKKCKEMFHTEQKEGKDFSGYLFSTAFE